jgi:hypothetical protein
VRLQDTLHYILVGGGGPGFLLCYVGSLVMYCRYCVDAPQRIVTESLYRGGIQERTVGLRFLGIILRVLRLEVSTLVLCLSTRCSS